MLIIFSKTWPRQFNLSLKRRIGKHSFVFNINVYLLFYVRTPTTLRIEEKAASFTSVAPLLYINIIREICI